MQSTREAAYEGTASHYVTVTSQNQPRLSLDDGDVGARERRRQQRRAKRLAGVKSRLMQVSSEPDMIDQYSRVLFPLIFVVFNILYWIIYQYISTSTLEEMYEKK